MKKDFVCYVTHMKMNANIIVNNWSESSKAQKNRETEEYLSFLLSKRIIVEMEKTPLY